MPSSFDGDHVRTSRVSLASVSSAESEAGAKHVVGDGSGSEGATTALGRDEGETHFLWSGRGMRGGEERRGKIY